MECNEFTYIVSMYIYVQSSTSFWSRFQGYGSTITEISPPEFSHFLFFLFLPNFPPSFLYIPSNLAYLSGSGSSSWLFSLLFLGTLSSPNICTVMEKKKQWHTQNSQVPYSRHYAWARIQSFDWQASDSVLRPFFLAIESTWQPSSSASNERT